MKTPRYRLVLREVDGTERTADFTSTTGDMYSVGDELHVEPEGESWRIVAEQESEPPFLAELVCERV